MLRVTGPVVEDLLSWDRFEDLAIADCPVAHREHQNWRVLQHSESPIAQALVEHRRLAVEPDQTDLLCDVGVDDTEQSDREQHRYKHAIHEGDVDHAHHGSVLEMDLVFRAAIDVDVLFVCFR